MNKLNRNRIRLFPVLFVVCLALQACSQTKFQVSGHAYLVQDYCGGMEPTDEDLRLLQTPHPIAGKKLFVKKGSVNSKSSKIIAISITDSSGNYSFKLPKGVYCILDEYKASDLVLPKPTKTTSADTLCLKNQHGKCDLIIQVFDYDLKNQNVTFYSHCAWSQPCMQYSGPVPPVMEKGKQE